MSQNSYRTAPENTEKMPGGVPYIIANEIAERFSFYGMRAILVIFMTQYLRNASGEIEGMSEGDATVWYHNFMAAAYFFPLIGAFLSDAILGKYRTIIWLSIVYCLGHLALALDETRLGLSVGLTLIAVGAGGIKPCVSAHVGDQFGERNKGLIGKVFGWFYFAINLGAFASMLITPILLDKFGPHVAFGTPGALMLLATWVFWLGRNKFIHVPAGGMAFVKETFSPVGLKALGKLLVLYALIGVFWAIYDQNGSTWVLQANKMNKEWLGFTWESSQVQSVNSIFVLIYIPLFTYVLYPLINKVWTLTPLRKIGMGFVITIFAVLVVAYIEKMIQAGDVPSIAWQVFAYVVLTAAEVMIYQTGLEFSYSQAPPKMKSIIMSIYLLSVSLGNWFTSGVNKFIMNEDGTSKLEGVAYHLFFAKCMGVATLVYIVYAYFYREQTFIQSTASASDEPAKHKGEHLDGA